MESSAHWNFFVGALFLSMCYCLFIINIIIFISFLSQSLLLAIKSVCRFFLINSQFLVWLTGEKIIMRFLLCKNLPFYFHRLFSCTFLLLYFTREFRRFLHWGRAITIFHNVRSKAKGQRSFYVPAIVLVSGFTLWFNNSSLRSVPVAPRRQIQQNRLIWCYDFMHCSLSRKTGCFLVLWKTLLDSYCFVVWILFLVFSFFCFASGGDRNTKKTAGKRDDKLCWDNGDKI